MMTIMRRMRETKEQVEIVMKVNFDAPCLLLAKKNAKLFFFMKNPLFLGPLVKYKNGIEVVTPSVDLVM